MTNRDKLLDILYEIDPDIDYENEQNLVEDGLFDSLEVMSIVMEIESVFNTAIDPDDIVAENFDSVEAILKMIEKNA